jgi:hypothetical protein
MSMRSDDASPDLDGLIRLAEKGQLARVFDFLRRRSRLPGPRPNLELATEFGAACARAGRGGEELATKLATLDANEAPGATELEFLPLCGVVALGAVAAKDPSAASRVLPLLQEAASDLRWRVRDAVPGALSSLGAKLGGGLLGEVEGFMDSFFPATAVLIAMAHPAWLSRILEPTLLLARLEEAFLLARGANRSAERYPGYKALVVALGTAPAELAARFGAPVFDLLARMSDVKEPVLRDAIAKNLANPKVARRFAGDAHRVERALEESAPKPRDPRSDVGPTRRRGGRPRR